MKKYWKYEIMPVFLDSVKDCTFLKMDDVDLAAVLVGIIKMSIEDFLFPKVPLTYEYDSMTDPLDHEPFGYYFTEEVTTAEIKVIIAWMRVYWVQMQLNNADNFSNPLFDKDIKGYSPAMMLKTIESVYNTTYKAAQTATFNYSRKSKGGAPALGEIHGNS